MKVKKYTVGT